MSGNTTSGHLSRLGFAKQVELAVWGELHQDSQTKEEAFDYLYDACGAVLYRIMNVVRLKERGLTREELLEVAKEGYVDRVLECLRSHISEYYSSLSKCVTMKELTEAGEEFVRRLSEGMTECVSECVTALTVKLTDRDILPNRYRPGRPWASYNRNACDLTAALTRLIEVAEKLTETETLAKLGYLAKLGLIESHVTQRSDLEPVGV